MSHDKNHHEFTLCSWQDLKIQLLIYQLIFNVNVHAFIEH